MDAFVLADSRAGRREGATSSNLPARGGLAALSLGAGAIHAWVVGPHWEEIPLFGVFFAVVAALQAAWALAVLTQLGPSFYLPGILGNAVVAGTWLLSRTAGIPLGPNPWESEPVGLLDALATGLELGIVVGAVLLLRGIDGDLTSRHAGARW